MTSCDAIIVGGGHNGLVAAHYLARAGLRVTVLERRSAVGGPCATVEFMPGYRTSVTNSPGSLEPKIASDMELARHGLSWVTPNPSLVMPFEGGRAFVGWREKERVVELLRSFSERDAKAYYEFFDSLNGFGHRLGVSLFAPPPDFGAVASRMTTPEDRATFRDIMFGSVRDFLDARLESPEIKALIATLALMSNMQGPSTPGSPYLLLQRPLSLASNSIASEHDPRRQVLRGSTGLPRGGMGSIAAAMEASVKSLGVEIRTNAAVAAILADENGVKGVALATGEEFRAPLVLSNLNPRIALLDLVEAKLLSSDLRLRLERMNMKGSSFKLVLALDAMPRWAAARDDEEARALAGCQFRVAPSMDYMQRGYDQAMLGEMPDSPMLWGLTPTLHSPEMAPPGHHLMSINVWHAPYHLRESWTNDARDRFGQRCIDVLAEHVPNLKDSIVDHRFISPVDLEREYGLVEGNATHGDMVPGITFGNRPLPELSDYRTPIRGLYLCGSAMWPGGTVSGIPGHNASHQALADLKQPGSALNRLLEARLA